MDQVLHIFRKDSRRFWPEILVSLVVLAALIGLAPMTWRVADTYRVLQLNSLAMRMELLVPLTWWLLLGRVVQAESLVGENQAWLTRPYEWWQLLAAKVLFCLVYVSLPLLVAQCVVLKLAGFAPHLFVAGLARDWWFLTSVLVLPLMTIAALTANFVRMTVTLIGVVLAAIGCGVLWAWRQDSALPIPYSGSAAGWQGAGFVVLVVGAVVAQYALRRTWLIRGLLVGLTLLGALSWALYRGHPDVDALYPPPAPGQAPATRLTFVNSGAQTVVRAYRADSHPDQIDVVLPVKLSEVPAGTASEINLVKVSMSAPGAYWESDWQNSYQMYVPGSGSAQVRFRMSKAEYHRWRGQPVGLKIAVAMSELKAQKTEQRTITGGEFGVPENGICAVNVTGDRRGLHCRYALVHPTQAYVTVEMPEAACGGAEERDSLHVSGHSWQGAFGGVGLPGISPVLAMGNHFFTELDRTTTLQPSFSLCPGTVMTFTQYGFVGRTRGTLEMAGFVLPAHAGGDDE